MPHIRPIQKRSIVGGLHLEDYQIAAEGICMVVREIRKKIFTHIIELLEMSNEDGTALWNKSDPFEFDPAVRLNLQETWHS